MLYLEKENKYTNKTLNINLFHYDFISETVLIFKVVYPKYFAL